MGNIEDIQDAIFYSYIEVYINVSMVLGTLNETHLTGRIGPSR